MFTFNQWRVQVSPCIPSFSFEKRFDQTWITFILTIYLWKRMLTHQLVTNMLITILLTIHFSGVWVWFWVRNRRQQNERDTSVNLQGILRYSVQPRMVIWTRYSSILGIGIQIDYPYSFHGDLNYPPNIYRFHSNTRSIRLVGRGTAAIGVIGVVGCNMYPLR